MTISVCVVALNEEKTLPRILNDILLQTYDKKLTEIILVDSNSTDNTKKVMEEFKKNNESLYLGVKIFDNDKKILPAGCNILIKNFTTDALLRIDAHAHIPEDFVEKNVKNLENGEDVSSGLRPCVNEVETPWTNTLLQVENSLFGSSVNKSRHSTKKQYVKTAFHGAYKREVIEKVGLYNEKLARTEDNDFNYRVNENGFKILYDTDITSYQFCRSSLKKMCKQKYGNGLWTALTLKVNPKCLSLFYFVPFAFIMAIIFTSVLGTFGLWAFPTILWGAYGFFAIFNTIISCINNGFTRFTILMPFLFLILHLSYGIGSIVGFIKLPKFKAK